MVGRFEVSYFELDILCPEVLLRTKCDWEGNRANWCRGVSRNDAIEGGFTRHGQAHVVKAHLHQCSCKDQVEPTSTINNNSSKLGSLDDKEAFLVQRSWCIDPPWKR